MAAIYKNKQFHPGWAAIIKQRFQRGAGSAASKHDIIHKCRLFSIQIERYVCLTDSRRFASDYWPVIPVQIDVNSANGNGYAIIFADNFCESSCQIKAAPLHAYERNAIRVAYYEFFCQVFLDAGHFFRMHNNFSRHVASRFLF